MTKRNDYISWDQFFMGIAELASRRSKDPNTRHGACIIDPINKKVLSVGYNGFPRGCSDDDFPWDRELKYSYVVHAEQNAIYNSNGNLQGSILYLYSERGYYPCCDCAKGIIQTGIKEVVLNDIKDNTGYDWEPTKKMFNASNIKIRILNT